MKNLKSNNDTSKLRSISSSGWYKDEDNQLYRKSWQFSEKLNDTVGTIERYNLKSKKWDMVHIIEE